VAGPRHIPELDGLRGIAILAVIVFHFHLHGDQSITSIGWAGVDLFFALSGFLITGILLDTERGPGMFRNFYARRCLRILPLYYLALALCFWVMPAAAGWPRVPGSEQLWYWFHLSNWRTAYFPLVYGRLTHFWSLAVEEQFYLFWPLVVLLCRRRATLWTAVGLSAAAVALRNLPSAQQTGQVYENFIYRLTPFRMDALLIGAVAAIVYRDAGLRQLAKKWSGWVAAAGAGITGACVAAAGSTSAFSEGMTRFGYTGIAVFCAAMVLMAALDSGSAAPVQRLLRSGVLRGFGKYSYCLYVIHPSLLGVRGYVHGFLGDGLMTGLLSAVAALACMYLIAMGSWYGFERHFLKLQARFR
jgi:peptidoglycan/LPS O-acetylase OafA/YrhL